MNDRWLVLLLTLGLPLMFTIGITITYSGMGEVRQSAPAPAVGLSEDGVNYRITCINDDGAVWFEREFGSIGIRGGGVFVLTHDGRKSYVSGDCLVVTLGKERP